MNSVDAVNSMRCTLVSYSDSIQVGVNLSVQVCPHRGGVGVGLPSEAPVVGATCHMALGRERVVSSRSAGSLDADLQVHGVALTVNPYIDQRSVFTSCACWHLMSALWCNVTAFIVGVSPCHLWSFLFLHLSTLQPHPLPQKWRIPPIVGSADRVSLYVCIQRSAQTKHPSLQLSYPPPTPPPLKIFSKQDPLSPLKRDPLSNAKWLSWPALTVGHLLDKRSWSVK